MAQISKIKLPNNIAYDITDVSAVHSTDKGVANGVAPLNASRLIDSIYLPSYVDDVIEGYYYNNKFWKESAHTTEISGEAGKIYIDLTVNPADTYRYTGSAFVKIGGSGSGGSVVTISRNLTSGTKSATINIDGTDYDLYSTDNTTYGAGTGISLTNNSFSIKLGYTTSGNNRAVQADGNGNLYVVQKDDNNTYSAGSGLSLSESTFNHSNSVTAQTTQAVYPIKIDAQGHISAYGSAVTIPSVTTSTTDITPGSTALATGSLYLVYE